MIFSENTRVTHQKQEQNIKLDKEYKIRKAEGKRAPFFGRFIE